MVIFSDNYRKSLDVSSSHVGPPQTRQIVIDDYLQSTTEWNRLLSVFGNAFPHKKSLVINNVHVLREPGNVLVMRMCTSCRKWRPLL